MEVMQVQDADQQEGRGDEDTREQIREAVLLQTDVPQSERQTENVNSLNTLRLKLVIYNV